MNVLGRKTDVRGKVVLVTGAARGIGAGVARELAARGATLALVGLEGDEMRAVARDCGGGADAWDADVTDWDALQRVTAEIAERYGRIDVVVANAGIAVPGFVRSVDPAAFEKVLEVDLLGVWRTVRVTLPHVIDARGYYLLVSSMAAITHIPGLGAYSMAKAGVEALANTMRAELAHLGVGVGVAHPIWIRTDMVDGADAHPVFGPLRKASLGPLSKTYPLSLAVRLLSGAVERRARAVHVPQWQWVGKMLRAAFPPLVEAGARRVMAGLDAAARRDVEQRGSEASTPVGAGGQAAVGKR